MNITSKIVALSSAEAFALQIALALLMLRYFSQEEVGVFSVISQIDFFLDHFGTGANAIAIADEPC